MPVGTVPVPSPHIEDEPTVALCINREWANVLIGQIWGLRYPEAWGGTLDENRRARGEIKNLIDMLMSEGGCGVNNCCVNVAITFRINPTTGLVEQSSNNGVTWAPAAGGIQSVIVQPVPPVTSGVAATKCDAATNVQTQVQAWIDHALADFDTAVSLLEFSIGILEAILVAVLTVLSAGALTPLEALVLPTLGAALAAAWGAGKAAFEAYWVPARLSEVLCAAYCYISEDGSFTDEQFSSFWNKLNVVMPPSPAKMLFMGFLSSVGKEGLNAMAASGTSADADCGDCVCIPCVPDTWTQGIWYLGVDHPERGGTITIVGDDYFVIHAAPRGDGDYEVAAYSIDHTTCCDINVQWCNSEGVVGDFAPSSVLKWQSACPANAAFEDMPRNDLYAYPSSVTGFYFQISPGDFYLRVTFMS